MIVMRAGGVNGNIPLKVNNQNRIIFQTMRQMLLQ